ncbi:uncharacterized protein LOC110734922 [Chenopodium quinoa]|uniref:uncharacterized protein LOC110734922 n=1 Tax=Chenopodium quinoa TaxID=63459 RepID=UPI000B76DE99|nr:uncharacterized protein LOC110734922 [Chenopodium quinoa]
MVMEVQEQLIKKDDIIVTSNDPKFLEGFVQKLSFRFSLKDLGDLSYFLGVEVMPHSNGLFLSQRKYINDILHKANMEDAKPIATPLPDIAFTVNKLAQYMQCPIEYHMQSLRRLLRYFSGTSHMGLLLDKDSPLTLHAYSDVDWAQLGIRMIIFPQQPTLFTLAKIPSLGRLRSNVLSGV